jgi:transcriptional regulator with PAS, ATPase and Fis domain
MDRDVVLNEVGEREPQKPAIVSGEGSPSGPVLQGIRVLSELVDGRDGVLFSIHPHGLVFHAATGATSARLARDLVQVGERLHSEVSGACAFGPIADAQEVEDVHFEASPLLDSTLLVAERCHHEVAFGFAVTRPNVPQLPQARLRFAFAVFRDLTKLLQREARTAAPARALRGAWEEYRFGGLVGGSRQMRHVFRSIEKLAASDVNVLLLGESGTGKELAARAIHERGAFAGRKFVAQNCAALPDALLESELFGHCKGAFTGANYEKRGLFEEANGGTFFLDEIADMPLALQIKMLRVLQDGEIRRLGETRTRHVSVRLIAATNKNLAREVAEGRFRQDLYYRLNVVRLDLPSLRRRREDVPILARYFVDKICTRLERAPLDLSDEALQRFIEYEWPGNVRELENEIERLVALHGEVTAVQPWMLSERLRYGARVDWSLERLEEFHDLHRATEYLERAMIARSLERHAWNKSRAALELGVSRQGLIKKINRLQLVRPSAQPVARSSGWRQAFLPFEQVAEEDAARAPEAATVAGD